MSARQKLKYEYFIKKLNLLKFIKPILSHSYDIFYIQYIFILLLSRNRKKFSFYFQKEIYSLEISIELKLLQKKKVFYKSNK